jgi:hypothetical protein
VDAESQRLTGLRGGLSSASNGDSTSKMMGPVEILRAIAGVI